jgi:proteasome lid subunit RPN8/RPN11
MKLKELPGIYAMIIEKNKFFTLAFLMMPENSVIGWHSHPKMNAISKCLFGEI